MQIFLFYIIKRKLKLLFEIAFQIVVGVEVLKTDVNSVPMKVFAKQSLCKRDVGIVGSGPVGLALSCLLSHYGVSHFIVDRKLHPVVHPQAHFMNARTLEIIQTYLPDSHKKIIDMMSSSDKWRYSMLNFVLEMTALS